MCTPWALMPRLRAWRYSSERCYLFRVRPYGSIDRPGSVTQRRAVSGYRSENGDGARIASDRSGSGGWGRDFRRTWQSVGRSRGSNVDGVHRTGVSVSEAAAAVGEGDPGVRDSARGSGGWLEVCAGETRRSVI